MFTAEEKYQEIMRELKLRVRLYPHWVEIGNISAPEAKRRIDILAQVAADYGERLRD